MNLLKVMSLFKLWVALLCIICSVGLLVKELLQHKPNDELYLAEIFTSIYLVLGFVDMVTMLAVLRKVTRYQAEKKLQPEEIVEVDKIGCLEWVTGLSLLFYAFVTFLMVLNTEFHGLFLGQVDVSTTTKYVMDGFAIFYALLSILQLVALHCFAQESLKPVEIGTQYGMLENTYHQLDPVVYA